MKINRSFTLLLGLISALVPVIAFCQYDIDGSKWSFDGHADYAFASFVFNQTQTNQPFTSACDTAVPFVNDSNPATIKVTLNLATLSNNQFPSTNIVFTGTLNPVTGAFTMSTDPSIVYNIPFTYTSGTTTINGTVTYIKMILAGTVSGNRWVFLTPTWHHAGGVMTGNTAGSSGLIKGTISGIIPFTLTMSNMVYTGAICPGQGVDLSGHITLQEFVGNPAGTSTLFTVTNGTASDQFTTPLDSNGNFSFNYDKPGAVTIRAKATHWLSHTNTTPYNTLVGPVSGINFSLVNGDANQSNSIDDGDLLDIINDFLSTPNVHGFSDLNGSGAVDDVDLLIVINHFLANGN